MNKCKWLLAGGFALLAIFNSCKEDTGGVGANVLPSSDLISAHEADTSTILTSMYLKDSVPTNGANASLLGSYNDPIFGQVKASIYARIFAPNDASTVPWGDSGIVDSAILVLPYSGTGSYYGNLDPQTFEVDTLTATMDSGKAYYSDTSIKYSPFPIAIQQITPNPNYNSQLTIKMSKSWTQYIKNKLGYNGAVNDYIYFNSFVKGLYITVSNPLQLPGQGGIMYLNLTNTSLTPGIYFYWRGGAEDTVDNFTVFPVGTSNNYFTYFNHFSLNNATAPFANEHPVGKHDSINGNNLVYVQNMGGVIGRINFPNFYLNWSNLEKNLGPILINKAEVDISANAQDCPNPFFPPSNLYLLGTDKYGNPYSLPDQSSVTGYYGGSYDAYNNTYTFNITQYMQEVVQGKDTDRGLFIIPESQASSANRVVLYGAQHGVALPSNKRMQLKIFYTPLGRKAEKH